MKHHTHARRVGSSANAQKRTFLFFSRKLSVRTDTVCTHYLFFTVSDLCDKRWANTSLSLSLAVSHAWRPDRLSFLRKVMYPWQKRWLAASCSQWKLRSNAFNKEKRVLRTSACWILSLSFFPREQTTIIWSSLIRCAISEAENVFDEDLLLWLSEMMNLIETLCYQNNKGKNDDDQMRRRRKPTRHIHRNSFARHKHVHTKEEKRKDMQRIIILISTAMDVGVGFSSDDTRVIRVRLTDITWQKRTTVEGVLLRVIRYSFSSKRQTDRETERGFGIGVKRISIRKKPMSTLTHRTTAATVRMAESLREDPLLSTLFYDQ